MDIIAPINPVAIDAYCARCFDQLPGDSSPLAGLLRAELRIIVDKAGLSLADQEVLMLYSHGLDTEAIGAALGVDPVDVSRQEQRIFQRIRRIRNLGLLTVLVEAFGWSAFDMCAVR